jgi:uncharacterized membrane protein YagU involved in acid resistance
MTVEELIGDLAIASLAGVVGTKVMEPVSMALYEAEPQADREREDAVRPGPPYKIAAKKTLGAIGIDLEGDALEKAGMAFHYGLAISWAPMYALLRRSTRMNPIAAGLVAGAAMSLIVDEGMTPALGFSAPNRDYPATTHVRGFIAHLVFGLAIAAVTETAWAIAKRRS